VVVVVTGSTDRPVGSLPSVLVAVTVLTVTAGVGGAVGVASTTPAAVGGDGPSPQTSGTPTAGDPDAANVTLVRSDGRVRVTATADQVIGGRSDLETGVTVVVRLLATGGPNGSRDAVAATDADGQPVVGRTTAHVQAGGRFAARLDLAGVPPGDGYRVEVRTLAGDRLAAAPATVAPETPTATPTPPSGPWVQTNVRVPRGSTGDVGIRYGDAPTVTLVVGSQAAGYWLRATVVDADGDGTATVAFDSAAAGTDRRTVWARGGDDVRVAPGDEIRRDTRLRTGDYELALYRGETTAGRTVSLGSLFVAPAGEGPDAGVPPWERNGSSAMAAAPATATPPDRPNDDRGGDPVATETGAGTGAGSGTGTDGSGTGATSGSESGFGSGSESASGSRSGSAIGSGSASASATGSGPAVGVVPLVATLLVGSAFLAAGALVAFLILKRRRRPW
jgi:hypothetical protein